LTFIFGLNPLNRSQKFVAICIEFSFAANRLQRVSAARFDCWDQTCKTRNTTYFFLLFVVSCRLCAATRARAWSCHGPLPLEDMIRSIGNQAMKRVIVYRSLQPISGDCEGNRRPKFLLDLVRLHPTTSSAILIESQLRTINPQQSRTRMKRIGLVMSAIALLLLPPNYVYSQSGKSGARAKIGRPLLKSLPTNVEGVELVGNKVRTKSGYKFVKQANGTVTVARMAGGGGAGAGGSWSCSSCGNCSAVISGGYLTCQGSCTGNAACTLTVVVKGRATAVIAY